MGCAQAKSSTYSPKGIDQWKLSHGYVKGRKGGRPINQKQPGRDSRNYLVSFAKEDKYIVVNSNGGEDDRLAERERVVPKKIGGDELVDGWPKWLVDNIPADVLGGLVPRSADSYDKLAKIGQGTYSNVYKARDRDTRKIVALKKVCFDTSEPESVKFMAREILILKKLDHPNVIKLEGLATSRMHYSLYLVFDFMQSDLTKIISRHDERLPEAQVKCYMQQLLSGLQHCHERGILHRDIKPSNLLIDKSGVLKIADFGLANFYPPKQKRPLTNRVVTLWYRSPELLLGSTDYGVGIDLWIVGCLFAEMFYRRPIMPGRTEVEQLHRIFRLCGSPLEDYWKIMKLPTSFRPPQHYKPSFEETFSTFPTSSFGLLTTLLALDPTSRGSAASALESEMSKHGKFFLCSHYNVFFTSSPLPCHVSLLRPKKPKDESQTTDRNKRRTSKTNQSSQSNHGAHKRKDLIDQAGGDFGSSKEERNAEYLSHVMFKSASSSSYSSKMIGHEVSLLASLSPILHSHIKEITKNGGSSKCSQEHQEPYPLTGLYNRYHQPQGRQHNVSI